jgi:hypothetical protein
MRVNGNTRRDLLLRAAGSTAGAAAARTTSNETREERSSGERALAPRGSALRCICIVFVLNCSHGAGRRLNGYRRPELLPQCRSRCCLACTPNVYKVICKCIYVHNGQRTWRRGARPPCDLGSQADADCPGGSQNTRRAAAGKAVKRVDVSFESFKTTLSTIQQCIAPLTGIVSMRQSQACTSRES